MMLVYVSCNFFHVVQYPSDVGRVTRSLRKFPNLMSCALNGIRPWKISLGVHRKPWWYVVLCAITAVTAA